MAVLVSMASVVAVAEEPLVPLSILALTEAVMAEFLPQQEEMVLLIPEAEEAAAVGLVLMAAQQPSMG
jgi:hypothetical protein